MLCQHVQEDAAFATESECSLNLGLLKLEVAFEVFLVLGGLPAPVFGAMKLDAQALDDVVVRARLGRCPRS